MSPIIAGIGQTRSPVVMRLLDLSPFSFGLVPQHQRSSQPPPGARLTRGGCGRSLADCGGVRPVEQPPATRVAGHLDRPGLNC